jgi:uncharacterized repeat protein (TIGR01451 family)
MQSSIWKIVSLAGVVGTVFLIVLMAQNGLKQNGEELTESAAVAGADAGKTASGDIPRPEQSSGDFQWDSELTQSEPPVDNGPVTDDPFAADPFATDPFATDRGQPEPVIEFPGTTLAAEDPTLDLFPTLPDERITEVSRPILPEAAGPADFAASDPFPGTLPNAFDSVDSDAEEFPAPAAELFPGEELPANEGSNLRTIALELMRKSYRAIDDTDLQLARDKAVAAGELPVTWGALEESPAMLVARIDGMLNAVNLRNIAGATREPDPFPGSILPVSGEEPFPVIQPPATLVTDLNADPFGDPLPTSPDLLPAIDLPVIEEPLPAFDPFVNAPPESETTIDLPTLDAPIGDPFPTVETPQLAEFPFDPKPAAPITELTPIAEPAEPLVNVVTAPKPDVTIRKVAPAEATIGDPLIYSIEISNRGETNASEVIVEDRIPTGCKLVGTIPQAELIGSKILWRLGRLPARSDQKLLIKVIPLEEGEIGSVATVNFVAEVSTSTSVRPAAQPKIKLKVTNRETAKVGENVLFRFRIANEGATDAENVSLQDIVPAGFEHPAGKDVTYEIGNLPAGKAVDIDLELTAVKPGQHLNRAIVTSGKDSKVETAAAVEVVDDKGLTIQTPASRPQPVGQKTSHAIRVTNESSQPISGAAVNVILPDDLHFISASNNGAFTKASNSIRWSLAVVQPGETVTLSTTVVPRTYGVHSNRVQLIQPQKPMEQSNSLVEASGIAALRLTLEDAPATVLPGEDFIVEFSILNRGTGPDSNVQFSLVLPTGIDFVSARGPVRDLPPKAVATGRSISFVSIPEIGERASVDFQVTLRSRGAGRPKLRAEVRSDQLTDAVATEAAIVILDTTP